jgi:hypothetical protein
MQGQAQVALCRQDARLRSLSENPTQLGRKLLGGWDRWSLWANHYQRSPRFRPEGGGRLPVVDR